MTCLYHTNTSDILTEYLSGGYNISWKMAQGMYDDHGFFDDNTCDWVMSMMYPRRVFIKDIDGRGHWDSPVCDENLDHYNRIRTNDVVLMVWFGLLHDLPSNKPSQRSKEEIRDLISLSAVVSTYSTNVRKVGTYRYQAQCPFHKDRLPSLSIDDQKGLWNCHAGCGGGDVFSFIMKARDCDFRTALDMAQRYI